MTDTIDAARLTLLHNDLRLPAIKQGWAAFALRSDKEGWPAARFLAALAEHEVAERDRREVVPQPDRRRYRNLPRKDSMNHISGLLRIACVSQASRSLV